MVYDMDIPKYCRECGESDNSVSDEDDAVELYDADPNCEHVLDPNCMSGIRCTKCGGWFCY